MNTYNIEWSCVNLVESVDGSHLPEGFFDELESVESFKPLKRVVAPAICAGLTKIFAASEKDAVAQMRRVLNGKSIRLRVV